MKRIYLMLFMAFVGGQLFAQSTTQPNQTSAVNTQDKVSASSSSSISSYSRSQTVANANSVEELPGYPVLQNTGNVEKDKLNFDNAKEKWMKDNKALYDEFMLKEEKKKNQTEQPKN